MKIRTILAAALAVLTMASCSKDGTGNKENQNGEGGATKFTLALSLPQTLASKATQTATDEESDIDQVYVYVFNYDGTPAKTGAVSTKSFATDFYDKGNGYYELKSTEAIQTTTGDKVIYVLTNLASAPVASPTSEDDLLQIISDVQDDLLSFDGSGNLEKIVMAGKVSKTLVSEDFGPNEVEMDLDRAVARVTTTCDNTTVTKNWASTGDLTIKITKYFLTQDAHSSYLVPHYYGSGFPKTLIDGVSTSDFGTVVNPYKPSNHIGSGSTAINYLAIGADNAAARQDLPGFYIGENVTNNPEDVARYGATTYAFIQTQFELANGASVNGTIGAGATIEYNGTAIDGTTGFMLVRATKGGTTTDYICHEDEVDDVTDCLQADLNYDPDDIKTYEFPDSYVYYRVYLNREQTGKDKYNVYRNNFIHLAINDVNITPGSFGGGYPGEEDDPEVPIDPNDEDEGNNPNPWTPDPEPIDEDDATLVVSITVKPWTYVINNTTLE